MNKGISFFALYAICVELLALASALSGKRMDKPAEAIAAA